MSLGSRQPASELLVDVVMIHRVKYIESISRASVGQSGNITELLKHSY